MHLHIHPEPVQLVTPSEKTNELAPHRRLTRSSGESCGQKGGRKAGGLRKAAGRMAVAGGLQHPASFQGPCTCASKLLTAQAVSSSASRARPCHSTLKLRVALGALGGAARHDRQGTVYRHAARPASAAAPAAGR